MSVSMDIYMKLHEARCEQIKGNSSSAMSLYTCVHQMIQDAKATSQPKEQDNLDSIMEMVNEEICLVQKAMDASNAQSLSGTQETSCHPSVFPQVLQPNTQSAVASDCDVNNVANELIAKEILDDENSTHPPFCEQVKNDWEYIKKYSAIGAGYCATGFEMCVDGCKKMASAGSEYCSAGYEKCKEGYKKVSENPRVNAFTSSSKEAGYALLRGITDSFFLFIKAWKSLFTGNSSSNKQEVTAPAVNSSISEEAAETTSVPVSVFPSLPLENSVPTSQA